MKKIIIVSNSFWNIINFRKPIIKILLENNYKIHIIAPLRDHALYPFSEKVILHNIDIDRRGANIIKELILLLNLYKIIKRIEPNLILNFTIKPVIYVSLISRLLKIYTINTITGLGRVFIVRNLFLIKFIVELLYKISQKNVGQIIFHNTEDYNYFIRKKISSSHNSAIIHGSGINLNHLQYSKPKISNKFTFITISRLTAEKGIYDLIEAIKLVRKKTKIKISFLLFGSHEKNSQGGIPKENILQWENEGLIEYKGFVKTLNNYIKDCDALIHPSHREGSSRSIQESMSLGRPVIASDCKGNLESVINNYNGYIFKKKDVKNLYDKIIAFTKLDVNKRLELTINSRQTAERMFDENKISNSYLKFVNKLLKR